MKEVENWDLFPNFGWHEFNHGGPMMKEAFMRKLQTARNICRSLALQAGYPDIPFIIISGSRSKERNLQAGGTPDSTHLYGVAADIRALDSRSRYFILKSLILAGFTRIGVKRSFIHVDMGELLTENRIKVDPNVIWLYE